jgi:hypothetical protein
MIASLIATQSLLKLLWTSLLAGVGVSVVFSLAIFGATRSRDMRRAGRGSAATAFAVLGTVALLGSAAIVVYGMLLVAHKS